MGNKSNTKDRNFMLDYVINLLNDVKDFSQGFLQRPAMLYFYAGWSRVRFDRVRRTHSQCHVVSNNNFNNRSPQKQSLVCVFNINSCMQKTEGV